MGDGDRSTHKRRTLYSRTRVYRGKRTRHDVHPGYPKRAVSVRRNSITFPPVVTQPTYSARAGYRIFNGDGTGTVVGTFSDNGVITLPDVQFDLSYTINADCTGTYTVLNPAAPTVEIFVAPNGEEFVAIETSNGRANDAFSSRRVGPE